jgi:hypothetical protein
VEVTFEIALAHQAKRICSGPIFVAEFKTISTVGHPHLLAEDFSG